MREDVDRELLRTKGNNVLLYIRIELMPTVEASQLPFYDTSSSYLEA